MTPTIELGVAHPATGRPGVLLRPPSHPTFGTSLEALIPIGEREKVEKERAWWVSAEHWEDGRLLMLGYWPEVKVIGGAEGDYMIDRHMEVTPIETQITLFETVPGRG